MVSDPTAHLSNDTGPHPSLGGCYNINAAPGSGVCREARDGACVMYIEMGVDEEYLVDGGRYGADDSIEGAERARARKSRNYRTLIKSTSTPCDPQSPDQTYCAADKCDVIIGSETYCSQCESTYVPIDGVCNTIDNANGKCIPKNDGIAVRAWSLTTSTVEAATPRAPMDTMETATFASRAAQ